MARKLKGATPKVIKTTAAQLQDAIRDAAGASQRAANANSNKSTALSDYCAKSGLPAKSVKLILDCHKMEDVKRRDFVLGFLMAHQMMGWGEQSDLFDDVGKMISEATAAAEADEKSRKGQAQGSPGLPLEEAEREFTKNNAKASAKREAKATTPSEAMRDSTAAGDAFLKEQTAKGGRNALPGAPALGNGPQRQSASVE
ncbi:hypothetical protein FPV16_15080 [Methylobacterium sp. W2]|uniref:hypothetical protein n=1 Tax=Methylobacterium sp. W2 TaxID=2598107 RepID=UPI001D0C9DD2|nr:hypothetical protein [Methylobacterium sp. W2]MCC0807537.1 hypothetical protein [Methylobacterium sp. W2]